MKAEQLRDKSVADLQKELEALLQEQFNLRMQQAVGQATKPDQFGKVRKNIARIKTILREKEMQA